MHPARRSRGPAHLGAHPCRLATGAWVLLLALLALALPREGAALEWSGSPGEGRVLVEVSGPDGEVYERWRTWDGVERARPGILADLDPTPGRVSLRLDLVGPDCAARLAGATNAAEPGTAPATSRAVRVPPDARAVLLTHEDERHTTVVCAAARDGRVELPVTEGDLRGGVIGLPALEARSRGPELRLDPRPRLWPRPPTETTPWVLRALLLPLTVALGGLGLWALGRTRRWPHLAWAVTASVIGAAGALRGVIAAPSTRMLDAGGAFTDAANSVATIAAVAESLTRLSDRSLAFAVPDGHTWLVLGSSWGAYALAAPLAWLTDPLTAHNLTLFVLLVLLGLSAQALARHAGASPVAAALAAFGAAWSPRLLGELDQLSLDRAWLFPVPLFVVALDRAADEEGWRWPALAGAALAATLLGQVHYGLYLAAAAPLLVLPRLLGPAPLRRLRRLALAGGVAGLLASPVLVGLTVGTADTDLATDGPRLIEVADSLWEPVPGPEAAAWLERWSSQDADRNRPLVEPQDRLLASVSNSLAPSDLLTPGTTLLGGGIYALLLGCALVAARPRRRAARVAVDVLILMVLSLGPFLREASGALGAPLPYYLPHLLIPGFDQLKHPVRISMLAATLSTVPLAVGWSSLLGRLRRLPAAGEAALAGLLALGLAGLHWRVPDEISDQPHVAPPGIGADVVLAWDPPRATVQDRAPAAALAGLEGERAVVLPHAEPIPTEAYLPALQAGIRLVNAPPDGAPAAAGGASWWESNAWLNRVARTSGSLRPGRSAGTPWQADRSELDAAGVRTVVVFEDLLPAGGLAEDTAGWLRERADLVRREDGVSVWRLR